MAKSSAKQRQKTRQRKAAKRKKRKERRGPSLPARRSPRAIVRASGSWPLYECLLTKEWQEEGNIIQILVARRSPQGQIAVGAFLVDLGCLGVKSAFARLFDSKREYKKLRNDTTSRQKMTKADVNLVAKIIREGIAYAKELGFRPDPDYRDAMPVLGDADPDACDVLVPLGKDGKPFFFAGPYDNAERIIAKLTRKLGPDGFHFVMPVGGDEEMFFLDD
ncbi:MAG: hypothetical protein GY832_21775 [Chloroflexi bacterium]|nr:hypothetical protein [Chloroflexota bacterium]